MKKTLVLAVAAVTLVSSCNTATGGGAYAGASLGSILGSAIGGIAGGPRGSDIGTIVGMAGGAMIGGVAGAQVDKAEKAEVHERYERIQQQKAQQQQDYQGQYSNDDTYYGQQPAEESGFDPTNSGDDRLYDFHGPDYTGSYSASDPTTTTPATSSVDDLASLYNYSEAIEISNARFVDDNRNNQIERGEVCKVIFEVRNRSDKTLYDVVPTVVEASNNSQIYISPSVHVESLAPHQGIRYTAMVKASNRLKDGTARFCLSVLQGGQSISKVTEFDIATVKRKNSTQK